jgi:hypothetical protein
MKTPSSLFKPFRVALVCTAAAATALSFTSCKVRQTQEAKAPEVEVKDGQMPKFDVDPAKVTVQPKETEVTVPKITTEERTVTVPDVDVTMPDDQPTPTPTP